LKEEALVNQFWQALPHATLKGRVLALPESVHFMGDPRVGSRIFVRPCYEEYFQLFLQARQAGVQDFVFTGTPGIGKSHFLYYCMWRLVTGPEPIARRILFQCEPPGAPLLEFRVGHTAVDITVLEQPPADYSGHFLLIDMKAVVPPIHFNGVNMMFSSPNMDRYKEFLKRSGSVKYYMPPCSLEELQQMREAVFPAVSEATVERLFDIYGGVPRFVLKNSSLDDAALKDALAKQTNYSELISAAGDDAAAERKARSTLVHLIPDPGNPQAARLCWASPRVVDEVLAKWSKAILQDMSDMVLATDALDSPAALRGRLFEAYAHSQLVCGQSSQLTSLADRNITLTFPSFADGVVHVFTNQTNLAILAPQLYHRPAKRNMTSVDAFAKDTAGNLFLFQMTVAKRHPVKASGLLDIINTFGAGCTAVHLVFVLPACQSSDEFQGLQGLLGSNGKVLQRSPAELKSLRQWVCKVPLQVG
jgi:hypothetical protein